MIAQPVRIGKGRSAPFDSWRLDGESLSVRVILATLALGFAAVAVGASAAPQLAARGVTATRAAGDCHAVKFVTVRGSGT
jgi:hypothetical protein